MGVKKQVTHIQSEHKNDATDNFDQLLQTVAENLKLPLLQIARSAELAQITNKSSQAFNAIELTADSALQLLDNYILSLRLANQQPLQLEPVSVAAILAEVAEKLHRVAAQHQCDIELHLAGKYEPIMANRAGLSAALSSLGHVFIEASGIQASTKRAAITLAAHRSKRGIVAGMFADIDGLSTDAYKRARSIFGQARQPLTQFTSSTGAGVFVAESLLAPMAAHLRIARHQKLSGLAATFNSSEQLQLV